MNHFRSFHLVVASAQAAHAEDKSMIRVAAKFEADTGRKTQLVITKPKTVISEPFNEGPSPQEVVAFAEKKRADAAR